MDQKTKRVLRFGEFRLVPEERQLWRGEEAVSLPPKVFDLLVVMAEHPGTLLEKEFLLKSIWPDTFVEEANLSVHVSTLRRALGGIAAAAHLIETVPKKGYRFVAPVEEVAHPAPSAVPAASPVEPKRSNRIWWFVAGAAIVLTCLLVWTTGRTVPDGPEVRSIAVLPFTGLNSDASQDYLGLGMADALITRLSGVHNLSVRPTSSVLKYSAQKTGIAGIGRDLAVDAVVEGRVQRSEESVRVTVQLLRVRDGASLWADHFEDRFTNIFAVQDSIAAKIATALRMKLGDLTLREVSKGGTGDPVAYQYYLQGRYQASRRTESSTRQGIEFFNKALEKDPDYALAYSAAAGEYITKSSYGWREELTEKAKSSALKALALDPNLPDAHVALGQILMRADWDWAGAMKAFERAIALEPNNAAAHAGRSLVLTAQANHAEAIREMEMACKLDPGNASLRSDLAWTYNYARNFEAALDNAKAAVQMDEQSFTSHRELNKAYLELKQFDRALEQVRAMAWIAGAENRRSLAESAQIYALAGRREEALKTLERLRSEKFPDAQPFYLIAVANANLGNRDEAFRGLNAALDARIAQAIWMKADPELDAIRADPRFGMLLSRLGLGK